MKIMTKKEPLDLFRLSCAHLSAIPNKEKIEKSIPKGVNGKSWNNIAKLIEYAMARGF